MIFLDQINAFFGPSNDQHFLTHLVLLNGTVKIAPNPINEVYPIYQRFFGPPIPIIRFMIILIIIYLFT